ncbi:MAG: hypothetical protein NVSMB47_10030 [Polyangiales bacterium]
MTTKAERRSIGAAEVAQRPSPRAGATAQFGLLAFALMLSCAAPVDARAERCADVRRELARCVGEAAARLDCGTVSEGDLDRLHAATHDLACSLVAEALPLDGDLESATCRLLDVGCVAPRTPPPENTPPRYPIVLVNGIDTSPLFRYSPRIVDALRAQGSVVELATLAPYAPSSERAPQLWQRISEVRAKHHADKVNLICHSLGGLDCRYVASAGGLAADLGQDPALFAGAIASITTIGTAHRGTRVADVALGLLPDGDRGAVVDALATVLGDWFSEEALARDARLRDALAALTLSNAPAFNAQIVDAPGVYYQSWAGVSRPFGEITTALDARTAAVCAADGAAHDALRSHDFMALPLVPFAALAADSTAGTGDPSDGLASVASAKWGTFRGCIGADHMEQLGQRNLPDVNVRTGLDVAWFYAGVAADLAGRGL